MLLLLPLLLLAPLGALACLAPALARARDAWRPGVTAAAFVLALVLAGACSRRGPVTGANLWLRADALSALVTLVVTSVSLACAAYGEYYMPVVLDRERAEDRWPAGATRRSSSRSCPACCSARSRTTSACCGSRSRRRRSPRRCSSATTAARARSGPAGSTCCSAPSASRSRCSRPCSSTTPAVHVLGDGSRGLHWTRAARRWRRRSIRAS